MKYLKSTLKRLAFVLIIIVLVPALVVAQLVSVALIIPCIPIFWIFTGEDLIDRCDFLWEACIIVYPIKFMVEKFLD